MNNPDTSVTMTHLDKFLAEKGWDRLYAYAYRLTHDKDQAEEVVQRTLLWAVTSTSYVEKEGNLDYFGWLKLKATATRKDVHRDAQRAGFVEDGNSYLDATYGANVQITESEDCHDGKEGCAETMAHGRTLVTDSDEAATSLSLDIQKALASLTPEERDIAQWSMLDELSWYEIHERYCTTYRLIPRHNMAVERLVATARAKVQAFLSAYAPPTRREEPATVKLAA